jgi:hypothetical protein
MFYALNNPADANRYFNSDNLDITTFSLGTNAIELFTSFLKWGLDLSFLGCFLIFNIVGVIGLLAIAGALKKVTSRSTPYIKWFVDIILFLPSISFWSSAIGKDAFSFLATGLALWASLDINKRKSILIFAIAVMLLVRPHMAGILVIAISVAILFDKRTNIQIKSALTVIFIPTLIILIPFALNYAGVGSDISADKMGDYLAKKQNHNMGGGSSIDIASLSLPMKMFTYIFRPLPYEAHNVTALLASVDNILLLGLVIFSIKYIRHKNLKYDPTNRLFLWFYTVGSLLILSLTTANLGIAMRQKWMFLPMLIYLCISAYVYAVSYHPRQFNHKSDSRKM